MKSNEFITEDDNNISQLKTDIIRQVKKTSDEELLDRIYTVLNKSDLVSRISGTLERDTDTVGYVEELTKIIIDTPGTFQEKYEFIDGFPTGYVDIKLMLSGNRVKFEELLSKNIEKLLLEIESLKPSMPDRINTITTIAANISTALGLFIK